MKKKASKILSTTIIYEALVIIGILAIPMCVFLGVIMIVWTFTDKLVQKLEQYQKDNSIDIIKPSQERRRDK